MVRSIQSKGPRLGSKISMLSTIQVHNQPMHRRKRTPGGVSDRTTRRRKTGYEDWNSGYPHRFQQNHKRIYLLQDGYAWYAVQKSGNGYQKISPVMPTKKEAEAYVYYYFGYPPAGVI